MLLLGISATAQKPYSFKVTDIKARLFYDFLGTFSPEDVINDKEFTLFNTVIADGDAESPSETTLVLIEITSGSIDDRSGPQLVVEARGDKNILLYRKSTFIGFLDKKEGLKKYVPFILYDTGCFEIKVTAKLYRDNRRKSPLLSQMTKTIPFVCGE